MELLGSVAKPRVMIFVKSSYREGGVDLVNPMSQKKKNDLRILHLEVTIKREDKDSASTQ
jgi:hypothetical protein